MNPNKYTAAVLERAFDIVQSVPYQVSARWLFYRLLQEGYYSTKQDYANKFLKAVSAARKSFYGAWRPDTLADETRTPIHRGVGWDNGASWLDAVSKAECELDKWHSQNFYLECWYEARAMTDQFRHYTEHVTLRPMGGQPSIPYKWQTAKELERAASRYGNPIVILYFGDLDPAGEQISKTVESDVREWCSAPFEFIRCGLTAEQVRRYDVPENIEHPGAFQWEALSDSGARDIIQGNISRFLRHDAILEVIERERHASEFLSKLLKTAIREYEEQ